MEPPQVKQLKDGATRLHNAVRRHERRANAQGWALAAVLVVFVGWCVAIYLKG